MTNAPTALAQRVWSYAHILKDDGLAFMDYTEQITYLLFLKMSWEQRLTSTSAVPSRYTWGALCNIADDAKRLERYHQGLRKLSGYPGLIGLIFTKPQSKINNPAHLRLLMQMMDTVNWSGLDVDVKGQAYEELLARNAYEVRGGAGQYFTPRPVIRAILEVMRPSIGMEISDPACGTGGFLLGAFEYLRPKAKKAADDAFIRNKALHGVELVPNVARLCAMNLFLHSIGTDSRRPVITIKDSLASATEPVDMVLTNPPFGKKSSLTIVGQDGKKQIESFSYKRPDFWATTSNKQLNFVQHVYSMLKEGGRAAIVVPDNVLFESGAGEKIRRELLKRCNVHTLLRLPTGIWYSPGVKANVLFFDKSPKAKSQTANEIWIYDLRNDKNFSLKSNLIRSEDLSDFVACYNADDLNQRKETNKFRRFGYGDILRGEKANLDFRWQHEGLSAVAQDSPQELMRQILDDLKEAVREFSAVQNQIRN